MEGESGERKERKGERGKDFLNDVFFCVCVIFQVFAFQDCDRARSKSKSKKSIAEENRAKSERGAAAG